MRKFIGNPKIKTDLEQCEQIKEYAIAFCQYINAGGNVCDFTSTMVDKIIDCAMVLKADRDYSYKYLGKDIPKYNEDGSKAEFILN